MGQRISTVKRKISTISDSIVSEGSIVIARRLSSVDEQSNTPTKSENIMLSIRETPESPQHDLGQKT